MSIPIKPISISLSPNTEKDDIGLCFRLPRKRGESIKKLENAFKKYLSIRHAFSFNSGRSSLVAILKSLELEEGSEVLIQSFTCNAASNPIKWSKLKPVFVDINNDFNIDVNDLKNKLTKKK
jgi:dTDP-4-amino-4,6-dideoxygalactose transaminase